jgi:hypothetical protein
MDAGIMINDARLGTVLRTADSPSTYCAGPSGEFFRARSRETARFLNACSAAYLRQAVISYCDRLAKMLDMQVAFCSVARDTIEVWAG